VGTPLDFFGLLIAVVVLVRAVRAFSAERQDVRGWVALLGGLRKTVTTNAFEGLVRLEGTAEKLSETIKSPVHQHPCLAYRLEVERLVGTHSRRPRWQVLTMEGDAVPFLLRDGAGTARVAADSKAVCEFQSEATVEQGPLGKLPEHVRELLDGLEIESRGLMLAPDLRVRERRLDEGEGCVVVGEVLRREAVDGPETYRSAATLPVIGAGETKLHIGDRSGSALLLPFRLRQGMHLGLAVLSAAGAAVFAGRLFGLL
jgi:hypothetical protein